ncbi:recombinase zinc beta ribbon domain-containing protein, partial [Faecalibacterium prausnitzii]
AGHIIYEAKPTVSMKSKKRRYIPFEERAIVPNTHEAIIPQDRWENVQRILYSRSGCFMCDKTDYDNIFKGIVRCADCGRTMLVKVEHRRKRNSVLDQTFYCCSTYRKYGAKACDSHNLEARVLHEAVFADIQAHAKAAVSNREALVKKIANQMHLRVSSDRAQHKRDLKQCKARIAEIEDLY